ncbi:MAG TPA: sulfotransferase, partial [Gammaproteobacteria bacterium]|nr:sulfotransferase [Gammaproteobacteria bacterium]
KANEQNCNIVADVRGIDHIDLQAERITRRIAHCDPGVWNDIPSAKNSSECPVFVVGMPRSGTTLVEQILASHPLVHGAGELRAVEDMARTLFPGNRYQSSYPDGFGSISEHTLERYATLHLRQLENLSGAASRVVDKCPHNFMHLGLVSSLFPGAKIIHIARDPLDTCISIYFQLFTPQHAYACDLERLGRYYSIYRHLIAYWNSVLSIPILNIQYEHLVAEPEKISRSLVEFCGLEWNDRCLEFHATKRDVNTPSYGQVRQPVYTRSVSRWKHYREYLRPLMDSLEASVDT